MSQQGSYNFNQYQPPQYGQQQQQYGGGYQQQYGAYPPPQQQNVYDSNSGGYKQQPPPSTTNYSSSYSQNYQQQQQQQQPSYNYPPTGSSEPLTTSNAEKFKPTTKYNDVWATILWLITLAGFGVCAYLGITSAVEELNKPQGEKSINIALTGLDIVSLLLISVGGGFVLSLVYFLLMQKFAGTLIKIQAVLLIITMLGFGGFMVYVGNYFGGAIMLLFTLLYAYLLYSWRSRIPFAKLMLKTVTSIIGQYPATIFAGVIGLLLETAFAAVFFFTAFGWVIRVQSQGTTTTDSRGNQVTTVPTSFYAIYVFLLFQFYWTTQVIKTTVHVTVSGLFATYFFMGTSTGGGKVTVSVSNPTAASAKRALTTSFGSICYGSLVIAIIQTIRAILRMAANQAAQDGNLVGYFCAICADCFLSFIEGIVQYFNHYAYTQVAIYGKDYCSAAKATWNLVKTKGIDAIINDNLIGAVLTMGALFIGLLVGAVSYGYYAASSIPKNEIVYPIVIVIVAFLIGASLFIILGEVIESGTATTFVCLAEDPAALQRTKPELYAKVQQVYPSVQLY